jgi:hypothetical protein
MSQFTKLYMRPNIDNGGNVPAAGNMYECPDIIFTGTRPLSNYETELISARNYSTIWLDNLFLNKDNYIYVRGMNGNQSANATNSVALYYAESSIIQWPSKWQYNKIGTDLGPDQKGHIVDVKPNNIGVVDRPFVWRNVPKPSSDHYCLIAQFNDDQDSNPFPSVCTCLDMANLISNNLQWGWLNEKVSAYYKDEHVEFSYQTVLDIPVDIQEQERQYILSLDPTDSIKNCDGCQVSLMCSHDDFSDREIIINKTPVVNQNGWMASCQCTLEPGFSGLLSVYLYNPKGKTIPAGGGLPLKISYVTSKEELRAENALHLYNRELTDRICKQMDLKGVDKDSLAIVPLGGESGIIKRRRT